MFIERSDFDAPLAAIARRGYPIVGPTVSDGGIVYDEISYSAELPIGWTDEQEAGRYRLRRREDEALLGYAVGPRSWTKYLLPEIVDGPRHHFVVEVGSERGADVLTEVPLRAAAAADGEAATAVHARTASQMGRGSDVTGIEELLYRDYNHPRWDEVAASAPAMAIAKGQTRPVVDHRSAPPITGSGTS